MKTKHFLEDPSYAESLKDEWSAEFDAGNLNRAYDVAEQGLVETKDPYFYWFKYLALTKIHEEVFGKWDGHARFARTVDEYYNTLATFSFDDEEEENKLRNDLKDLLKIATDFVNNAHSQSDMTVSSISYECLGRAKALQIITMTVDQEQEKIALLEDSIRDLEKALESYKVAQNESRSREQREELQEDIDRVPELIDHVKNRLSKLKSGEETKALKKQAKAKTGGCFIATAATGSRNTNEVIFLQKFRDQQLIQSFWGRTFVRCYYFVSPPIAQFISKSTVLRKLVMSLIIKPLIWVVKTFFYNK